VPRVKEQSKKESFRTIELCYNCGTRYMVFAVFWFCIPRFF
jgi:hypothetical protein